MSTKDRALMVADHMQSEGVEVQKGIRAFYPEGVIANFSFADDKTALAEFVKANLEPQSLTQEQMEKECFNIHAKVRQGIPNNIEIRFTSGMQYFERNRYQLGNTVIKLQTEEHSSPFYLYLKAGETLEAGIFIGGDHACGFLVFKDEQGNDSFVRLTEFHLLSVQENTDPQKEVGLMTSYVWLTEKVFSGVLLASSLAPVKSLLLSEYLEAEWKRSNEATKKQLPDEVSKEDEYGKK